VYAAAVEKMVEIRYAGVAVARTSSLRELDTKGVFLGLAEPLPTGTDVVLRVGDEDVPSQVATVVESADLGKAGMRVAFRVTGKAHLFGEAVDAGEPEVAPNPPADVAASSPPPAAAASDDGAAEASAEAQAGDATVSSGGSASESRAVEPESSKKQKKRRR